MVLVQGIKNYIGVGLFFFGNKIVFIQIIGMENFFCFMFDVFLAIENF